MSSTGAAIGDEDDEAADRVAPRVAADVVGPTAGERAGGPPWPSRRACPAADVPAIDAVPGQAEEGGQQRDGSRHRDGHGDGRGVAHGGDRRDARQHEPMRLPTLVPTGTNYPT